MILKRRALLKAYLSLAFFLSMQAVVPLLRGFGSTDFDTEEGDSFQQLMWLVVYGFGALICVRHKSLLLSAFRRSPELGFTLVLVCASMLWSVSVGLTFRRAVALVGTTSIALLAVQLLREGELQSILSRTFKLAMVLSVCFAVLLPEYGVMTGLHQGAWRGIFTHKNIMGGWFGLVAVFFFAQALAGHRIGWIWFVVAVGLVFKSTSITALLVCTFSCAILLLSRANAHAGKLRPVLVLLTFCALLALLYGATGVYEQILSSAGRDVTLTGRTDVWTAVLPRLADRPILGYGYGAFWSGLENRLGLIEQSIGFRPAHAHNGFIDVALSIGLLGVALYAAVCVRMLWRAGGWAELPMSLFAKSFLIFFLIYNMTESFSLAQNSLYWILICIFSLGMRRGDDRR